MQKHESEVKKTRSFPFSLTKILVPLAALTSYKTDQYAVWMLALLIDGGLNTAIINSAFNKPETLPALAVVKLFLIRKALSLNFN